MTSLVVLPGLDGTATQLGDFVLALGSVFDAVTVVTYPRDQPLGYAELEALVLAALPSNGSFVLLGESFSGPIALSIAASKPARLIGVVLCASFAKAPIPALRPFAWLATFAPTHAVPMPILSWLLLGRWATPQLRSALKAALRSVSPSVLRARAAAAMRVNNVSFLPSISIPLMYLCATQDRLVSPSAGRRIIQAVPKATLVEVVGPHFLLQAAPVPCAKAVRDFANQLA